MRTFNYVAYIMRIVSGIDDVARGEDEIQCLLHSLDIAGNRTALNSKTSGQKYSLSSMRINDTMWIASTKRPVTRYRTLALSMRTISAGVTVNKGKAAGKRPVLGPLNIAQVLNSRKGAKHLTRHTRRPIRRHPISRTQIISATRQASSTALRSRHFPEANLVESPTRHPLPVRSTGDLRKKICDCIIKEDVNARSHLCGHQKYKTVFPVPAASSGMSSQLIILPECWMNITIPSRCEVETP
jgi:hypothetical protein